MSSKKLLICIPCRAKTSWQNNSIDEECPVMVLSRAENGDYNVSIDRKCGCEEPTRFRIHRSDLTSFLVANNKTWKVVHIE